MERLCNTPWIGIFDDQPTTDDLIESCMVSKKVKVMPHKYEEIRYYDYLCYLDSKMEKINETFIENYITEYFIQQNYALLLREHWFLKPEVWAEFYESMKQWRYYVQHQQYINYIEKNVKNGLSDTTQFHCAAGLLIRNMKHEKMVELNETWYEHIQECGIQDQISFFFVKQLFEEKTILAFAEWPFC